MALPVNVLVVDDAVVVRRMVSDVLTADPELRVVGTAANGHIAVQKVDQLQPDCVTMDIEMPEMSGLEALATLRRTHPRLPIIMFSTLTERGAAATLDALQLGASDYVTKPANVGSVSAAQKSIREQLIPKIKALCGRPAGSPSADAHVVASPGAVVVRPVARAVVAPKAIGVHRPPRLVVVGVSTGGPNALAALLPHVPKEFPVPIAIVQHMPPMFTRLLAERLNQHSPLEVVEAHDGMALRPGMVAIAPGGYHMVVEAKARTFVARLNQEPPENSCRPAVDPLFRSAVTACGAEVLAVVLTGMGQDGLRGCEVVRASGGQVVVQDQASSVVWGMPGFVAGAGLADDVLPLGEIAGALLRRVGAHASHLVTA